MKYILGIDIAKDKFDCCLLWSEQKLELKFHNTPRGFKQLWRWLGKAGAAPAEVWACMEAPAFTGRRCCVFCLRPA
jgi:transposase